MKRLTFTVAILLLTQGLTSCSQKSEILKQYRSSLGSGSFDYVVGVLVDGKNLKALEVILDDVNAKFRKNGGSFIATVAQFPQYDVGYLHLGNRQAIVGRNAVVDYINEKYSESIISCDLLWVKRTEEN